jgi:Mg-chelatase subunit ChlD
MSQPDFTVLIAQNEYLPEGGDDVNAIVTITSPDTVSAAPAEDAGSAEIIIIDCSGSMRSPQTKIAEARRARVRLRDGDRLCLGAWTVLTIRAP